LSRSLGDKHFNSLLSRTPELFEISLEKSRWILVAPTELLILLTRIIIYGNT
jgi:hypothetical protein